MINYLRTTDRNRSVDGGPLNHRGNQRLSNPGNAEVFPVNQPASPPIPAASGRRIAIYIAAVLGLGWLGPVIDQAVGTDSGGGPGQLFWLFLPIGAAMLLRWKSGDGFADAGLWPRYRQNRRWYDLSSAFYPVAMLTAIGGGIAVDHWDLYDNRSPLRFAAVAAIALIPFTFAAIAEEFGWRGYLTPRLEAAGVGRLANHTLVGVVWGLGTFPIWLMPGTTAPNRYGRWPLESSSARP